MIRVVAIVSAVCSGLVICVCIVFFAWAKLAARNRKLYRPTKPPQ